jgi:cytochrome c553
MKKFFLLFFTIFTTVIYASTQTIYEQKCGICHGNDGLKLAMGKSKTIKGMDVEQIVKGMNDYANGTRKSILLIKTSKKNFLKSYDEKTILEIAQYINKL